MTPREGRGVSAPPAGKFPAALLGLLLAAVALESRCAMGPAAPEEGPPAVAPAAAAPGGGSGGGMERAAERETLEQARLLAGQGREEEALRLLQNLPADPQAGRRAEVAEHVRLLEARIALKGGDRDLASFRLKELLEAAGSAFVVQNASLLLADLLYEQKVYADALPYYRAVLRQPDPPLSGEQESRIRFRMAWISYHDRGWRELAADYLRGVDPRRLGEAEREEWGYLRRRLAWSEIPPAALGLQDGNISAVRADRDDLWVGTWSGGLARLSRSSGASQLFWKDRESLEPNTVRSIEITDTRVWVGTYQGLWAYSKVDATWKPIEQFSRPKPVRVEAIRQIGSELYVGTLGRGLWKLDGRGWTEVRDGDVPGSFISCLEQADDLLLIGTLNLGLVLYDPATGRLSSFDRLNPGLTSRNVTMLLYEPAGRLWVGTYGEGLYLWEIGANRLHHYTRASGQIADDWVLCAASTPEATYFGTFGGGLSMLSRREERWSSFGLRSGLPSLDISAVSSAPPYLYLGTLGCGLAALDETMLVRDEP
jgi:hypothetical protein